VRIVKLLIVLDLVALVVGLGAWAFLRSDTRGNVANSGLRGALPPSGQRVPDLSSLGGLDPSMPSPEDLHGHPVLLVATCVECGGDTRSADLVGGFLQRLGQQELPVGTSVEAVVWDGDASSWRRRWHVPAAVTVHVADDAAAGVVRRRLGIGTPGTAQTYDATGKLREVDVATSGRAYAYDPDGRLRSSFSIGLLVAEDVAHDLRAIARD
jgi:hypothetical protein